MARTRANPRRGSDTGYDSRSVRLSEIAEKGHAHFRYDYDFGDDWKHTIEIEKTLPAEEGIQTKGLRIEQIVSQGHASPPGFWYDQEENEWVIVLEGSAAVQFEGEPETVELQQGSYLNIPAHARHRVAWTDPNQKTIWLAIHYGD